MEDKTGKSIKEEKIKLETHQSRSNSSGQYVMNDEIILF